MPKKRRYGRPRKREKRGGLTVVKVKYYLNVRGWGMRRIASHYGVTRQAVYQFCWRHGIKPLELDDAQARYEELIASEPETDGSSFIS